MASQAAAVRVGRIAPNRADAPRDSAIRQNTRLGDSAIRRFGNSVLNPRVLDGLGPGLAGRVEAHQGEGYTSSLSQANILSSSASRIPAAILLFE